MADLGLLAWVDEPSSAGIQFARGGDDWSSFTYRDLGDRARRAAAVLHERGVRRGDVVALVLTSGPDFVAGLFGTLLVGATAAPMAPPALFGDRDRYHDHLTNLLGAAAPRGVLAAPAHREVVGTALRAAGQAGTPVWEPDRTGAAGPYPLDARPGPDDIALLQFTSGSTGRSRGVAVARRAVEHNVAAIAAWLAMRPGDVTASWLPVHHDMGLIGCLLTPVLHGTGIHLMQPDQFVREPLRFLRRFAHHGATLSAMPGFGLAHILRRVRPEQLEGCDFTAWRAVVIGAERVDAQVLRGVTALLGPRGFDARALLPAYGLAEATLAVTGVPLDEPWTSVLVDPTRLAPGAAVEPGDPDVDRATVELAGSGRPLRGVAVQVVDEDGRPVGSDVVGELVVSGGSVASAYVTAGPSGSSAIEGGCVRTGDAGFLHAGNLFVLGRLGDAAKIHGRMLFAEDVEAVLADCGIPPHRAVALLGEANGRPTVVALLEHGNPDWVTQGTGRLHRLVPDAEVVVLDVPRGAITRTTSGKPRRRLLWSRYLRGELTRRSPVAAEPT